MCLFRGAVVRGCWFCMICLVVSVCRGFSVVWGGGCEGRCFYFFLFLIVFCFCTFSCEAHPQLSFLTVWLAHFFVLPVFVIVAVLATVWVCMAVALAMSNALVTVMACNEKGYSSTVVVVGVVGVTSTVCCQFSKWF